jgi:3-deoxy-manno-octulosonate cytidylyltransferase (CMP-KDO synthetase)
VEIGTSFLAIVPARMASTRLPEKPLRDLAGRPMILHVVDRARESGARAVYVATDDARVEAACAAAGADVVMTAAHHASGSERLAEACDLLGLENTDIVVNVQGDEPLMPPPVIRQVAGLLTAHTDADMASLYHRIEDPQEVFDPNVVKVVCDARGRALYFSRAPIPWEREVFRDPKPRPRGPHLRHVGIYAYRAGFLRRYVRLAAADIEEREALEQLRALYHGAVVQMAPACAAPGPGVDTPEDLERVRALMVAGT